MTRQISAGEIIPLRPGHSRVHNLFDPFAPVRADHRLAANDAGAALGKVVPFTHPRGYAPTWPAIPADLVWAARPHSMREDTWFAAFVTLSLAAHVGLFIAMWSEPVPLASIGVEVISVEFVLGATAPAGIAATEGEQHVNAAVASETKAAEVDKSEEKATAQPQALEIAREETAPEQQTEQPKAAETKLEKTTYDETAAPSQERAQTEQKPAVAMVETPSPETATARPEETPTPPEATPPPQPAERPIEKKERPKPVHAAPPKSVKDAMPAQEPRRVAAPTREKASHNAKASSPSTAANNVGVGRSDRDTNYPGLVSAHLRRYQQYPPDARSRGDQGTAMLSFGLDGGGRVTSARLARGSGVASLDQEVQAMVRRASPFPAPPDGRPRNFTVPIAFRLN